MGHGTSSNFWNSGNDGVRITVVNASSGTAVSSPLDFSNRTQKTSLLHFGKVNKLQYLGGAGLSLQSGVAYSCIRPTQSMPTIVSSKGQSNIEAVKRYFCSEYACMMVAQAAGVDYERMIAGEYKLLIEPIAYFTHKDDGIRTQEAMKLTLNDMFKVYMNNNIKLKPSTRANYLYLWDFYVKEEPFANMPLPQIHRSDILAFYTKLLKHGFAINSLESINTIVHPTLEMAVDDDYIRKNPSKGIYRKLKTDGSAPKPKRRIALTKTQQQNFLRFIAKSPTYSHWLPIMTVLLGTGMRVAECTGITKSDINLSENTISVNHNLIYRVIDGKAGFHITTPKTESGTRIIPILYPEVAEQLRLQIETIDALYPDDQLVLGGVHGFVFRNRTGSFMSAHNINRAIERISVTYNMEEMDQAELEDREPDLLPHFSVHNLRHTFCTRLCESTNDVKFIQQVMGHADFSTTMDIYTHITQENMQEKAKNISVNMKLM